MKSTDESVLFVTRQKCNPSPNRHDIPPPTRHGIARSVRCHLLSGRNCFPTYRPDRRCHAAYWRHGMTDEWESISPAERFVASLLTNIQASLWFASEAVMPREAGDRYFERGLLQ